ncbi:MAG: NAD-dependent epimerase, partial [Actinomycetota bacterium]|nr:NAD-dependent epimerase [Actinomycetota bacterium]
LLDTTRAQRDLGWIPEISADDALLDLLDGLRHGTGLPTPASAPRRKGRTGGLRSNRASKSVRG